MQTFLEFKQRMRAELWPGGEARELRVGHDSFFNAAMLDIQKWVPCVRQMNTSTWEFSTTKWENAKTVVNAPWGKIRRVYTVAGGTDKWRDKVRYRSSNYPAIECWARNLFAAITPTNSNTALPALQLGMRYADATQDSTVGRARVGAWAIDRKRLYIAPYLNSTETLIVDWDGVKSKWLDSDGVDEKYWTTDYEMAVKSYVMWKHELYYSRDRAAAKDAEAEYNNTLADLIYWCRENTKQQHDTACDAGGGGDETVGLSQEVVEDDDDAEEDTTEEDNVLFVVAGDVGEDSAEALALAAAIEANDSPEFLVLDGDLNYGSGYAIDLAHYDWARELGIVVPVLGNHDHDATLAAYAAFFADELLDRNNGRYYEYTNGPMHAFILDSDDREADGNSISSIQHDWLEAKAFLSPARWKFVFMHHPPYSSGTTYGSDANLQWGFAAMGISVIFTAHEHNFEHLLIDGVHYINIGLGGKSRYPFGAAISGSLFRYNTLEARVRVTLDCDECKIEVVNSAGVTVYTYTIEHE